MSQLPILSLDQEVQIIQKKFHIIGREKELKLILIAARAKKHILLEGEVGTGKTFMARAIAQYLNTIFYRIDGSEDVLSHVLVGYFDPPAVLAKGYIEDAFLYGPLSRAMMDGGCLFINELNRIPENTQNVLLAALDEKELTIPKLKQLTAKSGFLVICTQNPSAHVGVSALGEALKDRFVWLEIVYQSEAEERAIVEQNMDKSKPNVSNYAEIAVAITRATREHPDLRRGASIRAAIDLAQLVQAYGSEPGANFWKESAVMALFSKIEISESTDRNLKEIILEIVSKVMDHF